MASSQSEKGGHAIGERAVREEQNLAIGQIRCKNRRWIVTLSGNTRFQIIVLEAAQAARQVPGVRAVNTDAVRLVAGE